MKTTRRSCLHQIARTATCATGIGTRLPARGNHLKLVTLLLLLSGFSASRALASDPVGVYAIVDKVVFEPNETNPERIQVWGAFALSGEPFTGNTVHDRAGGTFLLAPPAGVTMQ